MPRSAADGPEGEMRFTPEVTAQVLKFLMSKLSPGDLEELDAQLMGSSSPMATDAALPSDDERRKFLKFGPTIRQSLRDARRQALGMDAKPDAFKGKSFAEMFPNAGRLKSL